ncbi:MAG: N-acetylneuraminate synthase family protein [Alphaproteobacteria bacterium]|nr:N-acetylneuraminate synthase family protein [Alphaproteobacteria bacterium]
MRRGPSFSAPIFIAEASSNHGRDLGRALDFVDAAAQAGCDAVKFQLFKIDRMFAPEILARSAKHRARRAWELPREHLAPLAERCLARRIQFSCTPFYLEAVEELRPFVAFYKIASYELLVDDLLRACARTGKPIVLSTGMATMDEIVRAASILRDAGASDVTLLHCVSAYPTPAAEANLAAIAAIREATGYPVGWSDHTRRPAVIERAVHRWGARAVEFHLDLDGEGAEYAAGHCWLPDEIAPVIARIRESLAADGEGFKGPQPSELSDRDWRADPRDGMRPLRHIRAAFEGAA